ncbi:hypothetical protein V6N12_058080 [Hibiscus sabdariffa]|uniref:Cell growth-regulating nucleolar protein-like winged helix domain-containing protein n=2 Tax=Hibiscus sabdariffa TaxID=183260 RepID=A0ABR2BP52_9ROSI
MKTGEPKHSTERTMFFEDDQENLYKLVQDKATTGKQGLGIKDRPKKIAGVHFQGKKTSFSDSEAEDSDDVGPPPKRMRCNALETEKADEPKLKLKKLCKRLLRQVPGDSLKLKRLKVLIDEQSSSVFSDFSSKKDAIAYLKRKLEGSSKFSVEGKRMDIAAVEVDELRPIEEGRDVRQHQVAVDIVSDGASLLERAKVSYAHVVADGKKSVDSNATPSLVDGDVVIMNEDIIVNREATIPSIQFSHGVHGQVDHNTIIVRLLG